LEQVISTNIQPRIDGLRIYPIALPSKGADRVAYVVDIPQSTSRAPHQSRDSKYYKRYNFRSVAMEDYEIRDIMRRASTPDLWVRFSFGPDDAASIRVPLPGSAHKTNPVSLRAHIGNRSATPAEYASIEIYLDAFFAVEFLSNDLISGGTTERHGRDFSVVRKSWSVRNQLPIFSEMIFYVGTMNVALPSDLFRIGGELEIGYAIRAPGCSVEEFVKIILQRGTLWIPKQASA
jgi:hypothetical protein